MCARRGRIVTPQSIFPSQQGTQTHMRSHTWDSVPCTARTSTYNFLCKNSPQFHNHTFSNALSKNQSYEPAQHPALYQLTLTGLPWPISVWGGCCTVRTNKTSIIFRSVRLVLFHKRGQRMVWDWAWFTGRHSALRPLSAADGYTSFPFPITISHSVFKSNQCH